MGNYIFNVKKFPDPGQIVVIKRSEYTTDSEISSKFLKPGAKAKVLKTSYMHQSRQNHQKIPLTTIIYANGERETHFTNNLEF